MEFLLDTNIVSLLLRGNIQLSAAVRDHLLQGDMMVLSSAVEYEVRRGLKYRDATGAASPL